MKPERTRVLSESTAPTGGGVSHSVSGAHSNCGDAETIDRAEVAALTIVPLPDQAGGQLGSDAHVSAAPGQTHPAKAPVEPIAVLPVPRAIPDDVGLLIELWRQRQDLRRAERRLDLQCQAICRRASGGDKVVAQRLWSSLKDGASGDGVALVLLPYTGAMSSLQGSASEIEKQIVRLVRKMPMWTGWAKDLRGMAELSLGGLIGEAARPVSHYRSVSAVWKRFGLAVIDGGRQRLTAGAEAALLHGYSPERRAYAFVLSTNLMRSQKADDPYRALYDRRKEYEMARGLPKAHAHNRALRVMVKELLKDAWVADRRLSANPVLRDE